MDHLAVLGATALVSSVLFSYLNVKKKKEKTFHIGISKKSDVIMDLTRNKKHLKNIPTIAINTI